MGTMRPPVPLIIGQYSLELHDFWGPHELWVAWAENKEWMKASEITVPSLFFLIMLKRKELRGQENNQISKNKVGYVPHVGGKEAHKTSHQQVCTLLLMFPCLILLFSQCQCP